MNLEERYKKAVKALKDISYDRVPSEGPEHNAYYDVMEYAERALVSIGESESQKWASSHEPKR